MNRVPSKGPSRRTRVAEEPASSLSLRPCSDRENPSPERERVPRRCPVSERTPIMATLAEQMQGERMARVALSMFAEPNDAATGRVLAQVGEIETLRLIESDDPVPGLARADALMWR